LLDIGERTLYRAKEGKIGHDRVHDPAPKTGAAAGPAGPKRGPKERRAEEDVRMLTRRDG